jgi:hypothetical protein
MLICKKCGADNPAGRVFCGGCGGKLDQSNFATARPKREWDRQRIITIVNACVAPTLTIIVVVIALICWPTGAEPTPGVSEEAAKKVTGQLKTLEALKLGQSLTLTLSESDINSYLKFIRARELGLDAVQVSLETGYVMVHLRRKSTRLKLGKLQATVSYDLTCVPVKNRLLVQKVSAGHLPLGPFKGSALRTMRRLFVGGREHELLRDITDITVEKDSAQVSCVK